MQAIRIERTDPMAPGARELLELLSDTLEGITGDSGKSSFNATDIDGENAAFVLAFDDCGTAVGCGAFRPLQDGVAEVKRMYARPGTKGVGASILAWMEREAAMLGYSEVWLETRRINSRAVNFYIKHGYSEIPNFGKYAERPEAICFAKKLKPCVV